MITTRRIESTGVTLELTPLIDMVFLLLTFFLVATTFHQVEREMKVVLPVAQSSEPLTTLLRELVINVDERGKVFVRGRQVERPELIELVSSLAARNPDQKVTVRGDRRATYAHIVSVLDVCKSHGIQEPYLDTVLTQ